MLKSAKMEQINIVVMNKDIDIITKEIINLKLLHLLKINSLQDWTGNLNTVNTEVINERHNPLAKRIKEIIKKMGIDEDKTKIHEEEIKPFDDMEAQKIIEEIELKLNPLFVKQEDEKLKTIKHQEIYKQLIPLPLDILRISATRKYSFLNILTGWVENKDFSKIKNELESIPNLIIPFRSEKNKILVFIAVLKNNKAILEKIIQITPFEKVEKPEEISGISGDIQKKIKDDLEQKKTALEKTEKKINALKEKYSFPLINLSKNIAMNQLTVKAKNYFKKTQHTYLVSGWIPFDEKDKLIKIVRKLTNDRCYIEEIPVNKIKAVKEGKVQVPVKLFSPSLLKPFELLINNYGLPEYGTLDPTLLVAITFLLMFGAMFGDIGHGLVLFLLGIFLLKSKKESIAKAAALITYGGGTSILFGFLFGSFFGFEIINPLWMRPIHNIMSFLKLTVIFGIILISSGIVINIINNLSHQNFKEGLFGKSGLMGGIIYWGGIGIISKKLIMPSVALNSWMIMGVIGIPLMLLFLRGPILKFLKKEMDFFPGGIANYLMEIMVEIVEIFVGYLANTISFVRIGAFALAHAGLFIAVFSLANILKEKTGGAFLSVGVLILGNIFIILLEGLVVTIQCVRLEYYEFFSKFFEGKGKKYIPIGK